MEKINQKMFDEVMNRINTAQNQIKFTKNQVVIYENGLEIYWIHFTQIDTAEKILRWAIHLREKMWFTGELVRFFMIKCMDRIGLNPYGL